MEASLRVNSYDDEIVRKFVVATMWWAGVAFLVGLLAGLQLAFWPLNTGQSPKQQN